MKFFGINKKNRFTALVVVLFIAAVVVSAWGPISGLLFGPSVTSVDQVPRITSEVLHSRLQAGEDILVVDTRAFSEYESLHIPGSVSIPLAETELRYSELEGHAAIVTYCT